MENKEEQFPIGTIVSFGPDDKTITKLTASILTARDAQPIQKSWFGDNIMTNPAVIAEMGAFFKDNHVRRVVMDQSVAGCPHVEGVDYPAGEECPYCPFWSNAGDQPPS